MKTPKLIELERQRLELVAESRATLRQLHDCKDAKRAAELDDQHSRLMRELDLNRLEIEEASLDPEEQARASRRPYPEGQAPAADGTSVWDSFRSSGWSDANGRQVRVLSANERLSDERRSGGMMFGDFVRAMVTGARNDDEKRALSEGTATAGGYTVPTPLAREFIDRLRSRSVAVRAGARTVPMDSQSLAIARLDTDPDVQWRAENATIDESDPTFSRVLFEAKALAGIVKVSRELLADSVNVSEILTNAFSQAMALEFDRAAIFGDGADGGPVGVLGTAGINEVSMGTNGAALTGYGPLIDAVYEMQVDNAENPTAMIAHPRTGAGLAKLVDGDGNPLRVPEMISRIPLLTTTAASIAETQGTSNNCSSIVFGDFRHLFLGMREEIRIEILRERYADTGQIGFLAWMRADVQLAHKASFSRLKGIKPA